jgi:hypothetical protein
MLDRRYELCRFRLRLFEASFIPTFLVVSNSPLLFRRYLPCHRDGGPGRPLGISPDLLLYQGFQLGCEDRKLIGRLRRYYRIILERQGLNFSLRDRNHRFQRQHGNGHALGHQWSHLLDRPDVLGDCPVAESRAIRFGYLLQQAIMVILQYINGSQELLERSLVQNWLALRTGWSLLHVGG